MRGGQDRLVLAGAAGASPQVCRALFLHVSGLQGTLMMLLLLGLVIFFGTHSTRIFAENWRTWQDLITVPLLAAGACAARSTMGNCSHPQTHWRNT